MTKPHVTPSRAQLRRHKKAVLVELVADLNETLARPVPANKATRVLLWHAREKVAGMLNTVISLSEATYQTGKRVRREVDRTIQLSYW